MALLAKALQHFEQISRQWEDEYAQIATVVIREKLERNKGCVYCRDRKMIALDIANDAITLESNGKMDLSSSDSWKVEISYCPICGRWLQGKQIDLSGLTSNQADYVLAVREMHEIKNKK